MAASEHLARLIALFEAADREISGRVADLEERGHLMTALERRERHAEVEVILFNLRKAAAEGKDAPASQLIAESYREGSDAAIRDVEELHPGAKVERGMGGPHARSAEILYANLSGSLEDGISYVGRRADDAYRRATLEELMRANAASRTRRQASSAIADRLRSQGIGAFRDRRGRVWALKTYAEMAARTTAREAVSMGTLNRLVENGLDLVKVHVRLGACAKCQQYAGKIYSIRGGHPRYPALAEVPPFHPRCTCVISAHVERVPATSTTPTTGSTAPVSTAPDPFVDDDPFAEDYYDPDDLPTAEELEQGKYEQALLDDFEKAETSRLFNIIHEQGGIKTRDDLREEYRAIPNTYKRRDGLAGDEMAEYLATYHPEFGIESENDLVQFFVNR